ncbi:alanine dehydrogenase [Salicibibacter halophilus]|uniref:Alanine dehydrogenase n=1 Tax=Salicibibacter halophilus TaxID=2502791 RepID=A0A514LJS4_9BACI|nr:alanine dehydrogenase [Salicibibacter halophilus]QDI92114.1 alanine dehydrogenase [Salicibibacter halophilus]
MKIGIPKEIKNNENRVAVTPAEVLQLQQSGHEIIVESGAGLGAGFEDAEYEKAGATISRTAKDTWNSEMVMKVKEPLPEEYSYFYDGLILLAYLHLAADKKLTKALVDKKVTGIAYETMQLDDGSLPLLTPMSEVAGRMASQIGAQFLEKMKGGRGILLSGLPGVQRGKVCIVGGGVVGTNAAKIAVGLGADVTILDLNPQRLRELEDIFGSDIQTLMSNPLNIANAVKEADLVIGAVLIPGGKAPKLITEKMVQSMKDGAVMIDVAVDQGGIVETIDRITTHDDPIYYKHGVVHYAVANIPSTVPRTSTIGLTATTIPYALQIANKGYEEACLNNSAIRRGINTFRGHVTHRAVADTHALAHVPFDELVTEKV